MQAATIFRRSITASRHYLGNGNSTALHDHLRFQSNIPSPEHVTNLLQEHLHSISVNPFRYYANLWKLALFRAKYDVTFRTDEFDIGSKQAFVIISRKLYSCDFEGLQGLMSEEAISRLRPAVQALNAQQREILNIQDGDVYGQFLWSAKFQKMSNGQEFFEILMAFHVFLGMEEFRNQHPQQSIGTLLQNAGRFVLSNVKFAKRLSPSVDTDWTIIYANYARMDASSAGRFSSRSK